MDGMGNGLTVWNVVEESRIRIKRGTEDYRDRVLVKMWEDSIARDVELKTLKKQEGTLVTVLKQTIKERDKTIGELNAAVEIFHSRENLKIMGQSNVGGYLKGLLDSSQIMEAH